ncbi:Rrf2 family transcriptional regulator [Xylophilus sp. GW821-FHT01B05]
MKHQGRLSNVLHALLHMAEQGGPMTSEALAVCLHTNPVVVRRTMAGLREAGFVVSERGHGGGWVLARDLASVTLLDVQMAVEEDAAAEAPPPECLVEQAVQRALQGSLQAADALLSTRLAQITLADLSADFHQRMQLHGAHHHHHDHPQGKPHDL